jgi:hypothetical protein
MLYQKRNCRLGKFDSRVDKGILTGYSMKRKTYKCFSPGLNRIMENVNVVIDETNVQKDKEGINDLEEHDDEEDLK